MADERLLPAGIRDERSRALLGLLDRFDALDLSRLLVYRIDDVDASTLPHLGWQFHVMGAEGWELAVSDGQRRELIKRALELHRYKGTRWSVRQALDALGVSAEIVEWFEPTAEDLAPYEFGLLARVRRPVRRDELLGAETSNAVRRTIDVYKNARSHLAWIAFAIDLDVPLGPVEVAEECLVIDRTPLRVRWFPCFDITASDAEALDPDPFEQWRVAVDVSPAPVLMGRPGHLDREVSERFADTGLQMDQRLPFREGEWVPPLELIQRTVTSSAAIQVKAPAPVSTAAVRHGTAFEPDLFADASSNLRIDTALPATAAPAEGLDMMASFDAVAADFIPLDMPMETIHA